MVNAYMVKFTTAAIILIMAVLYSTAQSPLFKSITSKETGIRFSNDINETENLNVLAYEYFYNGGGVAVGDINNDGLPDIYFTANMKPNKLFLNTGNMKFKDITKTAGDGMEGRTNAWKTGVTMADVNGDGWLDIYICYSGKFPDDQRRNQLFINKGNLTFEEKAAAFGLDDKSYSTQAAFFDYDNDGDLDMFLLNHSTKKIDNMELARFRADIDELAGNKLYENRNNHFFDITRQARITQNPLTFGLGIAIADINKDGWQDIYVSNDYNEPDYLYINNHDGTFSEQSQQYFRHLAQFSMGVDIADFNNDGLPDLMSLDMLPEDNRRQKLLQLQENYESFQLMLDQNLYKQYMRNMLQLNNGDSTFSEIAQFAGVSNTDWSWCPLFADFDNDGYKDLFITNGYLRDYTNKDFLRYWGDYKIKKAIDREPAKLMDLVMAMPSTTLSNYMFRNNHDLTFSNMKEWGVNEAGVSSGAVYADLDNDGDLDLIINRINAEPLIYRNMSIEQKKGNYINLQLVYTNPNINAVGAKAYVYTSNGMQYQELNPNRGYLSCVSTLIHFGLGKQNTIDSIKIIWPNKTEQVQQHITANQQLRIEYKKEDPQYASTLNENKTLFEKDKDYINYTNIANDENDLKRQLLMLFMYSKAGPVIAKGDINKDGLQDVFISGNKNQAASIYIQKADGIFIATEDKIGNENTSTISAAAFFDADGDGFDDLYIAKGGYSLYDPGTKALQDELYINNGMGNLILSTGFLPELNASAKSCVRPCDYDNDGDIDIFIGGRIIPGKYPSPPTSYLLNNDGKGKFNIVAIPFSTTGMVTDARWADINKDGRKDIVLCGEFMPISIFINLPTGFVDRTSTYFTQPETGLWFSLQVADINGDGDEDIIAGNIGQNTQLHITEKEPATLYYADFDNNGSIDPFVNFYIQGTSYPFVSRDELNEQIYSMRKKFTSYKDYSTATMLNVFTKEELDKAGKLTATENRSVCFLNRSGKFEKKPLPAQAQFSVVTNIQTGDYNKDGYTDILLLGNHSDNRLKLGSIDANYGCLFTGDGKGDFNYVLQTASGLCIKGDVKSAENIIVNKKNVLFIGICNEKMVFYSEQIK